MTMFATVRTTALAAILGISLLAVPKADAASLSITPDTGTVTVGSTLSFTVSIDSITPPSGDTWDGLDLGLFRQNGGSGFGFTGKCQDDSGLVIVATFCAAGSNGADWNWNSAFTTSQTVSGNLMTFSVQFTQLGENSISLERAIAIFATNSSGGFTTVNIPFSFTAANPILIDVIGVGVPVPEPTAFALLSVSLAGLGLVLRKTRRV
jgi:hypothetical protein